jgi:hypothetical protein
VAATLELLLLTAAAREARALLTDGVAERPRGGAVVAILVALLGFALLAALVVAKG